MTPPASKVVNNPRAKHGFRGRTCSITSVGSYVPERILTNGDLEKMVDTSDEWITTRTGIKQRRIAATDEYTSDMAAKAALRGGIRHRGCLFRIHLRARGRPAIHHVPRL